MPRAEGRANVMLSRRGWRARYMGAGVVEVGEMKVENITRVGSGEWPIRWGFKIVSEKLLKRNAPNKYIGFKDATAEGKERWKQS